MIDNETSLQNSENARNRKEIEAVNNPMPHNNTMLHEEARRSNFKFGFHDQVYLISNRFVSSREYIIIYVSMIIINLALLLWASLTEIDDSFMYPVFLSLEIVITFLFGIEVSVRMVKERWGYWRKCSNIFDVFVLTLCFVSILISFLNIKEMEQVDILVERSVLLVRYLIQFVRLYTIIRNKRKVEQLVYGNRAIEDVDFSGLDVDFNQDNSSSHIEHGNGGIEMTISQVEQKRVVSNLGHENDEIYHMEVKMSRGSVYINEAKS